ncbi:MAG: 4-hydroxybenzoate octaprenyltransferase [Phycisphaerales bacterium]
MPPVAAMSLPDAPVRGLVSRLAVAAADIKLAHSVFALPFAVLGAFLARDESISGGAFAVKAALVVFCMVTARTWAMLINRLADARIDAANPRTLRRAIARGALPFRSGVAFAAVSAALFLLGAGGFALHDRNIWPLALAPLVLAWLAFYSFAKRFTLLCHLLLGTALALSPLAAALAVRPESLLSTPTLWWMALMVTLWVAGFDVIYALQDTDFDASAGLHSIPSRLGPARAIMLSRVMHAGAGAALLIAGLRDPRLGWLFLAAVAVVWVLLIAEHAVLARRGKAGLDLAFFTLNGMVSCLVGAAGVVDLFW